MSRAAPFTEGLREGRLRFLRCAACQTASSLAPHACAGCGSPKLEWQQSAGTGAIYAASLVHRAPSEAFRQRLPYVLVLVDLDEGFRVMAGASRDLTIGERVQLDESATRAAGLAFFNLSGSIS
jgi:uncharacterized protein